jgi:antitoxin HicB
MGDNLQVYIEKLTPQEQAELETFAAFLIARRSLRHPEILTDEITMAELMHTSRAQIDRILKAKGNVTIETLQRAAALIGRELRLELV